MHIAGPCLVAPALLLGAAACASDPAPRPEPAEPVAFARVVVESSASLSPTRLGVALLWEVTPWDKLIGSIVPAEVNGPEVTLGLEAAPPEAVQKVQSDGDDGPYAAEARVALIDLDALPTDIGAGSPLTLTDIGSAVVATPDQVNHEYLLVWASGPIDSAGLPLIPGYQVWHSFATGNCQDDPAVVACLEEARAGGANEAEAYAECVQYDVQTTSVPLADHVFHIEATGEGPAVPPWAEYGFPFCLEGLCGATTCPG
ncbi:MAG TPA: hypothetical protein VK698_25405 [Kofleriaceae bacterium]|nr:hypothetical protein [Kofleriaceae bacterium]